MDGATWGLIGGIVGTLGGGAGAYIGCRTSYRHAVNAAQRRFYRRIFAVMIPIAVGFTITVWLASIGYWPRWTYYLVMGAWFTALLPAIHWMNRRLAELAFEKS